MEKKLEKVGVKVPRATVLIEKDQIPGILGMKSQATLKREALENMGKGQIEEESSDDSEEEKKE